MDRIYNKPSIVRGRQECYQNHCPGISDWLAGFIWGRGSKTRDYSISMVISSRPLPITERLKREFVSEEFDVTEQLQETRYEGSLLLVASHPEVKSWTLPRIGDRRLGTTMTDDFLQGFFDSKLTLYPDGLSVAGDNWIPDLALLLRKKGIRFREYAGQLVVPNSEGSKELVAGFARAIASEKEVLEKCAGWNAETQDEMLEEDTKRRFKDHADSYADDWFAGFILALGLKSYDPLDIELLSFPCEEMESRFHQEALSRGYWCKTQGNSMKVFPDPKLMDWLKTNSLDFSVLQPWGIAGAIAACSTASRHDSIELHSDPRYPLPLWIAEAARVAELELISDEDGRRKLRKRTPGSGNRVLELVELLLSDVPISSGLLPMDVNPNNDADAYGMPEYTLFDTEGNKRSREILEEALFGLVEDPDARKIVVRDIENVLSVEGPIHINCLCERIREIYEDFNPYFGTTMSFITSVLKKHYFDDPWAALSWEQYMNIKPRKKSRGRSPRGVHEIHPRELEAAFVWIARMEPRIAKHHLVQFVCRAMLPMIDPRNPPPELEEALQSAIEKGELNECKGRLVAATTDRAQRVRSSRD